MSKSHFKIPLIPVNLNHKKKDKNRFQRYLQVDVEDVFVSGEAGYAAFRIPAIVYHKDTVLAFCEARKGSSSDTGHIDLVLKRGKLSSGVKISWQDMQVISHSQTYRSMNPVPIVDKKRDAIILVYIQFPYSQSVSRIIRMGEMVEKVCVIKSTDLGVFWDDATDITSSIINTDDDWIVYASGPGHGIQMESGRLVVPGNFNIKKHCCTLNCLCDAASETSTHSNVIYSDDGGNSWQTGGHVPYCKEEKSVIRTNESQVLELQPGELYINCRTGTSNCGYRQQAFSTDSGLSFCSAQLTTLSEPKGSYFPYFVTQKGGCEGSIIAFPPPDGSSGPAWVLFSNPACQSSRCQMSVHLSCDGCTTWSEAQCLYQGPSAYSDLAHLGTVKSGDGGETTPRFACLYECGKSSPVEKISLQIFNLKEMNFSCLY